MVDIKDVQLKTMANIPYQYGTIPIAPKSLRQIISSGFDRFYYCLRMVTLSKNQVFPPEVLDSYKESSLIETLFITGGYSFLDDYFDAFQYFLDKEVSVEPDMKFYIGGVLATPVDFDNISQIIKTQNSLVTEEDEDFNPLNDRVRLLKERMKKRKEKIAELKSQSDDGSKLDFLEIVSILSSKGNGINIHNVFDLNYFQFNDQFTRMKMVEDYEVNINALMHDKIDPKNIVHWMSKSKQAK